MWPIRAIIAGGPNAWYGHYGANNCELRDGDLVLFDCAPDYHYYTSDIGRMWPVNGCYTPQQRELYGFIVEYHKVLLRLIRPGVTDSQIQQEFKPAGRPVIKGWISSNYGYRKDPFTGKRAFHRGVDIAGKKDSEVFAVASGVVSWAGKKSGYGYLVEIRHPDGYVTRYGHNSMIFVKTGDLVDKGTVIGLMGSSGRSTGPHVHFEIARNGKSINPKKYLN